MIRSMFLTVEPISRRDIVIAAVLSLLGLALMYDNAVDHTVKASYLAMPVFLAFTIPVLWRRAAPLAALAAASAGLLIHIALFGTVTRCGVVFPVTWALVYSAGARLERDAALVALALGVCCVVAMASSDSQIPLQSAALFGPVTIVVWGAGRFARSRGRLATELRRRTAELRRVRDERARLETAADRARLSQELDELLHRRLAELAELAEIGAQGGDGAARTAILVDIERESRDTLEQMRALVGVLRQTDTMAEPIAPQPTLTSLDALLVQARRGDARLTVEGSPRAMPAGVELSAYRIIEHLLGALDDAAGVEVRIRFGSAALEIRVTGPATRRWQIGMSVERAREHAQLHRGSLEAKISGGKADVLAELPFAAAA